MLTDQTISSLFLSPNDMNLGNTSKPEKWALYCISYKHFYSALYSEKSHANRSDGFAVRGLIPPYGKRHQRPLRWDSFFWFVWWDSMVFNCLLTMIRIWFNKAFLRNQFLFIPQCSGFSCDRVDFLRSILYEAMICWYVLWSMICAENTVDNEILITAKQGLCSRRTLYPKTGCYLLQTEQQWAQMSSSKQIKNLFRSCLYKWFYHKTTKLQDCRNICCLKDKKTKCVCLLQMKIIPQSFCTIL